MAEERKRLVKLVRDDVGRFLGDDIAVSYKYLNDGDLHRRLLRAKLFEEAAEYLLNPSVDELADILQVVCDLAKVDLDTFIEDVELVRADKARERGTFYHGTGMYCTTTAPTTHEGEHG